jgi:hypothetical protein
MSRASRLTMIPLAALSASLLVPQVTLAASLPQQHQQQQYQQQATCSNFEIDLLPFQSGLNIPAIVVINTSTETAIVDEYNGGQLIPIQPQLKTNADGSLTLTITVSNGTSNTFTLSWQSDGSLLVTPGASNYPSASAFTTTPECLDTTSSTTSTGTTTSIGTGTKGTKGATGTTTTSTGTGTTKTTVSLSSALRK